MKEMKQSSSSPIITHFTLNTGATIPAVGLGTWQADGDVCKAAVRTALEAGYRHFDCAHLYGNEREVGQALKEALGLDCPGDKALGNKASGDESLGKEAVGDGVSQGAIPGLRREDLFISSKIWCTANTPRHMDESVEVSLRSLGLSYLDLYMVHWPRASAIGDATDPPRAKPGKMCARIDEVWHAMERLVERGVVRAIGVSNFDIPQIEELLCTARIVPAVNQVELHPFWRQDDLLKFCQAKGIHVSAHTPLGVPGSSLATFSESGTSFDHEVLSPTVHSTFLRSGSVHAPLLKASSIAIIAEQLQKTPAQAYALVGSEALVSWHIALEMWERLLPYLAMSSDLEELIGMVILRWGLERGTSVLPRSLNPHRIRSNFDILNWSLSEEHWNETNSMEPQFPLIDAHYSYLPHNAPLPLQAVDELDDDNEQICE